jgi:hypothetical protein
MEASLTNDQVDRPRAPVTPPPCYMPATRTVAGLDAPPTYNSGITTTTTTTTALAIPPGYENSIFFNVTLGHIVESAEASTTTRRRQTGASPRTRSSRGRQGAVICLVIALGLVGVGFLVYKVTKAASQTDAEG